MSGIRKKISWLLKRHPLLYYIRFALICKNFRGNWEDLPTFNDINSKEDVPEIFFTINRDITFNENVDTFDKALDIARHMRKIIKGGRGLGLASDESLETMINGGGGICSDYSQVFNVFCLINDIKVREWGLVEKFYNPLLGHTVNEVFSEKFQKWMLIDVGKNLYFTRQNEELPLSAIELFTYLREGNKLGYVHFSDHVCIDMYKIDQTYSKYAIPFLHINYDNKIYDQFLRKYRNYPNFVANALMILSGKNYRFLFPMDNYRDKLLHR